ncbi:uncharacterized protein PFL1_01317 [Pseudozyma flocculosa PF-1]|uniref:Uncharacterized protein n=1 Tax=Pseudozyma flocculosa TaxID=84751 RepID=A0A5C3EVB8_9BASI|nr:uncharacterized protein PFL1_01317 [Pseudozyma flocculosa PF-1]EPQ31128.1 hypothetical protein PFL1_01317 [Pseudozyma flocculosa PF-1]SPO35992.1 uncharacterized protein PSFLO_01463 [Pseudozyma flocculosa]
MDEFGYHATHSLSAEIRPEGSSKDSLKLRPLMLPGLSAQNQYPPVQRLNIPNSRSVPSGCVIRRVSPGRRQHHPPRRTIESEAESSSESDYEMGPDRRRATASHDVVFDCLSPEHSVSGQGRGALSRSRSETFSFPLPPTDRPRPAGRLPSTRRRPTATALRVPSSVRTASFRADAEAFINQASPCLPLAACTFSPMQWPASLALSGSQGWSPDSSRAASPVLVDAGLVMEKSDSKSGSIGCEVLRPDEDLVCSPISSGRSERSMPPSYQQASQLPAYQDQQSSPPCLDDGAGSDSSESEAESDADAQKLARLHASFHLLDNDGELLLSSGRQEPSASLDHVLGLSVEEQMAFLCGMGYRYRKPTASLVPSLTDNEDASDYDGERAEVGSSWSSSHDSDETRVEHSPIQLAEQQGRRQPSIRFGAEVDRRLASNATSARSSPILSGALSADRLDAEPLDKVGSLNLGGDDSMPTTPADVASPLGPNEIDVTRLCARPLAFNTPSPRFDRTDKEAAVTLKDEDMAGTPLIMREFSYLVDDSLQWSSNSTATTPREEKAAHLCDSPFDAPLTTPELELDGCILDPMEALPSPLPVGARPLVGDHEATPASQSGQMERSPLPTLTRSITCPTGFEQEGSTRFEMVPQFHRPFSGQLTLPPKVPRPTVRPTDDGLAPGRPGLPTSMSTSVLSRPRPLGRQTASSFFAGTDLQATEMSFAKARRLGARRPSVPARHSSLDLKGEFERGQSDASEEARSYFSSDSEFDDDEDDESCSSTTAAMDCRRNSDPAKRSKRLSQVSKKSDSFPNPHLGLDPARAASIHRRNAARELSASDLARAYDVSTRHRDLLAASSLAAAAARSRRRPAQLHRDNPDGGSVASEEESEPEQQGTYYLSPATTSAAKRYDARSKSLPTLYVARTEAQRRQGVTGLDETEPARIADVERYVAARRAGKFGRGAAAIPKPSKLRSRSSRVVALFAGRSGGLDTLKGPEVDEERSVIRLNTPRRGVLIVEEKWVEVV